MAFSVNTETTWKLQLFSLSHPFRLVIRRPVAIIPAIPDLEFYWPGGPIRHLEFDFISLLSIDVEGLNFEVLQGARKTIDRALMICLEYDTEEDRQNFSQVLGDGFELYREMGCNLIFVNRSLCERLQTGETKIKLRA